MTSTAASFWQVHLFGQCECWQGDTPCSLPAASDARSLFAYLVLHPGRLFPRSVLAELLAPDMPESQARHALSQALWHIRRSMPGLLESDASQVGIAPQLEVWVDALEFQALVERSLAGQEQPAAVLADLRQAVDLYRGDLLEGYYDDWVLLNREQMRELYLQVLSRLVTAYKAALQYQQALITAQHLVSADPLNEAAHREVMRLYQYLGCPADAMHQYETIRRILREEFDLEPEGETSQIAQAIAQRTGHAAAPYVPEPQIGPDSTLLNAQTVLAIPLVGRSPERACLGDWLRQNQSGNGKLILVEGEAGVGKTRLLQEAARDIEWRGAQVLWGKAAPFADYRPLGPLVAALDSGLNPLRVEQLQYLVEPLWLQVLQLLLPSLVQRLSRAEPLPQLEDGQAKIRMIEGLIHVLAAWAKINPLVIIIEDIHWADADTMDTLIELAYRLENEDVSLVLSYRREDLAGLPEIQAKVDVIRPEAVRGRLALDGLNAAAVHELVQASLGVGKINPAFQLALSQETEGNPLFILEILQRLYEEGLLRRTETGDWVTPHDSAIGEVDLPLPPAVGQLILHRLEQLPEDLRHLLEGLAVLGGEFNFERVVCLDLAEAPVLVAQLQALCRRRLLDELPQAYRFRHDKIRQVVYENLGAAQRTDWHARLAAVLQQTHPEQVEHLAYHYSQAQDWKKAVEYHLQSAVKARQSNAYGTALDHLNLALELAEQAQLPPEERFRILEMHVEIVEVLGLIQLWQEDLDVMTGLAGNDPLRLAIARQRNIEFLLQTGHYTEAEGAARQASILAEQLGNHLSQAAALASLGNALDLRGDRQASTDSLERAIHIFQELGDRRGEADARSHLANVLAKSEQRAAARAEFEASLALFEAINYQPGCADTLAVLGVLSDFDGNFEDSIHYCERSLDICHAIGYRMGEAYASHEMASVLLKLGQIGKCLRVAQDTIGICHAVGERRIEVVLHGFLSQIYCTYIGDYAAAIHEAEAALAIARAIADPIAEGMCLNDLGEAMLFTGRLEQAKEYQQLALEVFQANNSELRTPDVYLSLARFNLVIAQPQAALDELARAEALSQKYGLAGYTKSLVSLHAEALLVLERPEEALNILSQEISRLIAKKGVYYPLHFLHYKILTRQGFSAEARQALQQAYQGLTEMLEGLSNEQQALSRQQIAMHRNILEIWQIAQPRCIVMHLPSCSAPLGRPLRADEWVQVNWTIAAPEDDDIPGKVERRRARLLRLLQEASQQGAAPANDHLGQALGVSVRTIVADLIALKPTNEQLLRTSLRGRSGQQTSKARQP